MKKEYKCPCCGDEAKSLKERRNSETKEPMLACEYCWEYADRFWYYYDEGFFPEYKGISIGETVWCKMVYNDGTEEWFQGIVNSILRIFAGGKCMNLYDCCIDDNDGAIESDLFWEDEIWFRDPSSSPNDNLLESADLERTIETTSIDIKLIENRFVDSLY